MVNYASSARSVDVAWSGKRPMAAGKVHNAHVLTAASPDDQNTLDMPDVVVPAELAPMPSVASGGKTLSVEMPAWSLVVVEVALG